ncbi:T9SS type A sorting domain-containing protein [Hymenobacter negativus]|uniref:T9SS type A sorting domain-containing protein n=1 Tax=Hymenobacter negativus TaxID=2795026 RepID=A0ABS3QN08_9BACT|nr:T9SS type A sorting domain-containing protein [Hymenobacter negativus]MBO2012487.1 T9SS type A sorting domain-containing protein [Hymenobacter negativus]
MKASLLPLGLLATALSASAQTPITITQANFPALPTTVEQYSRASITGVTPPTTGANQAWDYRALSATSQLTNTYNAPPSQPVFAGTTRTFNYTLALGPLTVQGKVHQAYTATGLTGLGSELATQRFGLGALTGSPTDSLVVPAQNVPVSVPVFVFPTTVGTVTRSFQRNGTYGLLTVGLVGLSRVPLRLVQRIAIVDSVAGWGTMRIPTSAGVSTAIPVLMRRQRSIEVDSFYLGGQPAPAALLQVLGVQQGVVSSDYSDNFYRAGSSQSLAEFGYTSATYQTLNAVVYSREASVLTATRNALATELGGLNAYPNPLANGPLTLVAGNASRQPLRLTVRDVLGRPLATATAITGESTTILNGLPAGTYLLEAEGAAGARSTVRVVRE